MNRRQFGKTLGGAFASVALGGACAADGKLSAEARDGRLAARPKAGAVTSAKGENRLGLDPKRDAVLHLPPSLSGPLPLLVLFHGADSSGEIQLRRFHETPDDAGVAVLAIDSRGITWDAIRGGFGPDVDFVNRALQRVFDTVNVDPTRLTIGGFSDGATYALSLGLINGDLFPRIAAFSAGFVVDGVPHGRPRVFMSHGVDDDILPIDHCGRRIAAELKQRGYDVVFREFQGKHEIPPDIAREGLKWIAAPGS